MSTPSIQGPGPDQIDLRQVFGTVRRYAPLLILAPAVAAGGAYLFAKQAPPVYEASASVIALDNDAQNALINNTLVTAPPLPQGAVEQVMQSRGLLTKVVSRLEKTDLDSQTVQAIQKDLNNELADHRFSRFKVRARLDNQQRGVYQLSATAGTPEAARLLADAGVQELIEWDNDRAKQGVLRSRASLQEQLKLISARIAQTPASDLERQSLIAARGQLMQNLSQVAVLETAASGTLVLVAEPVAPRTPVTPRPLRSAALAGLITLFLSVAAALLTDSLRRRVNNADDLAPLGLPLLGQLPMVRSKDMTGGFVKVSQGGPLFESIGFLRINILSLLTTGTQRRIAFSSAYASEGKSSITAALADSLGASGLKVLVVDADLRRPTQLKIWAPQERRSVPLAGTNPALPPAETVTEAFLRPNAAHVLRVSENVDLLPAGTPQRGAAAPSLLSQPAFQAHLDEWAQGYDFVLIDTPPMLSLPDTLAVAPRTDGVVLVVEEDKARLADVERTLQNARVANVKVLGLVLNKAAQRRSAYYAYGYGTGGAATAGGRSDL